VVSVTLLFTAAPLIPRNAAIGAASGTAVLAVLAWYKRCRAAAPFSTFCVICLGLALSGVLYFQVVLALGRGRIPQRRKAIHGYRRGQTHRVS